MLGHLYPHEVTAQHINALCQIWRAQTPSSRVTAHSRIRHVLHLLGCPPCSDGYPIVPTVTPREVTVPDSEFTAVLEAAGPKLRLALLLARDAALRISACLKLEHRHIDFEANEIAGKTKRNTNYRVAMTKRLRDELAYASHIAKPGKPIICTFNRYGLQPHQSSLSHELIKVKKTLGISRPWGFHDLRRTAARALYQRTGDIRKVQSLLGHTSLTPTLWYLGNAGQQPSAEELEAIRKDLL